MLNVKTKIIILCSSLILIWASCRKADKLSTPIQAAQPGSSMEEKFFNSHRSTDTREKELVSFLQRKNKTDKFVEKTVSQVGYPRWDKAITKFEKGSAYGRDYSDSSSATYYIPFVRDSQNFVNASLIIKTYPTDTTFFRSSLLNTPN